MIAVLWIVGLSILCQLAAVILAIRLLKVVGKHWAWILIASAIALQLVRRVISLRNLVIGKIMASQIMATQTVDLIVSALMVVGVAAIGPLFRALRASIIQRERDQAALRNSQDIYRKLYEGIPDAYGKVDMDGRLLEFNQSFLSMVGYDADEIRRLTYKDLTPEKWHAFEDEIIKNQVRARGSSDVYEKEYRRKDGTVFPVELRTFLQRDSSGRPAAMWAIIRDISGRKLAQEELHRSEEELKKAQHFARLGSWTWDLRTNHVEASDEMYRLHGLDRSTFKGELAEALDRPVHPDDRGKLDGARADFREKGRTLALDYRIIWPDGSVHVLWTETGEVIRDKAGRPIILKGYHQDITERKRNEEALVQSEKRYRDLANSLPICIFETNLTGGLTFANWKAFDSFGYSEADLLAGADMMQMLAEADRPRAMKNFQNVLRSRNISSGEYTVKRKDGSCFEALITSRPIEKDGQVVGLRAVLMDITDRKEAEGALRESAERYRGLVEQSLIGIGISLQNQVIFANPALLDIFGYDDLEKFTKIPLLNHVAPASREYIIARMRRLAAGEEIEPDFEYNILRKDGQQRRLHAWTNHITLKGKIYTQTVFQDITERKQQETRVLQLNRLYLTLKEVNELIVRSRDRQILFDGVCRILTTTGGFQLAWIGLKEGDGAVTVAAGAGPSASYLDGLRFRWDDTPLGRGPAGRAIREKRTIVFRDIKTEPDYEPWLEKAVASGLRSTGAFSLLESDQVIGAIVIYVSEPGFIAEAETGLLEELAIDVGFALQTMAVGEERLAAEKALGESEEKYRLAVENLSEILYIADTEGRINFINSAAERLLGYKPEEIVGRNWLEFVYPPDIALLRKRVALLVRGPIEPLEFRLKKSDGGPLWVLSTSKPIYVGGRIVAVQGVLGDITERKRIMEELEEHRRNLEKLVQERTADLTAARAAALNLMQDAELQRLETEKALAESRRIGAALKDSEDRTRRILRTTQEGFCYMDVRGRIVEVNEALCVILGRKSDELVGRLLADFLDEQGAALIRNEAGFWRQRKSGAIESRVKRPDGSIAVCVFYGTPLENSAGERIGSFAMVSDITSRKVAEEELRRHAEELEAFNRAMVDREGKIIEMKEEVNRLYRELGRPPAYLPIWDEEPAGKAKG